MKTFTSQIFMFLILATWFNFFSLQSNAQSFSGGDGSAGNPYQLTSKAEVLEVKNFPDASFILMNNIDFVGEEPYTSSIIGTFNGKFDGQGYQISNITLEGSISFFGTISTTGTVKNLHIRNLSFTAYFYSNGSTNAKNQYHAPFAYTNNGLIENCSYEGTVESYAYLAGFVLNNNGTIKNCYSNATINAHDGMNISNNWFPGKYAGGFVRYNNTLGIIMNCYSAGTVTVGDLGAAGFVHDNAGQISNCFAFNTAISSTWYGSVVHRFANSSSGTLTNIYALNTMTLNGSTTTSDNSSSIEGADIISDLIPVQSTYIALGWDFMRNWRLESGDSYPQLRVLPDCPAITLSNIVLSSCENSGVNQTVTASGGEGTYIYAISNGSLPAGLSLSAAGVVSGIPTTSGTYNFTISATDENGCFGTKDFSFIVHPNVTSSISESICQGESYLFGSQTLTTSGVYTETFETIHGCDSTVTLTLTVHPGYNLPAPESHVAYYPFDGDANDESGNGLNGTVNGATLTDDRNGNPSSAYFFNGYAGLNGIDVEHSDELYMNGPFSISLWLKPEIAQDALILGKSNFTLTTNYWVRISSDGNIFWDYNGIQATTTNPLQPNNWYHIVLTANNPGGLKNIYINGQLISGTSSYPSNMNFGNVTTRLTIGYASYFSDYFKGAIDEIRIFGKELKEDEIAILNDESLLVQDAEICEGDSYSFGGTDYTEAGEYEHTFTTINGCDSTVTLILTVNPVYNHTEQATICEGDSYTFGTETLTTAGEYEKTFSSIHGCDSTVTLTLTVNPVYNQTVQANICEGESYLFGTETLTTAGEYLKTFTSIHGCDSTVTLVLTVYPSYNNPVSDCEVLITTVNVYNGNNYLLTYVHGEYGEEFSLADWNDLLAIDDIDAWIACKGLQNQDCFWILNNGQHFYDGTHHYFVQYNPGGAHGYFDFHAEIGNKLFLYSWYGLDIPILAKNNNPSVKLQVCSNELPYHFGTQSLTEPGQYTEVFQTIHGCDSTVTITLTVNPEYNHTDVASICQGESYTFGTQTLTTSGEYEKTFTSINGCDSTVVLTLTVNPEYNHTVEAGICEGESYPFGTETLTTSGEYEKTFTSINGCDSTVVLTLTVNPVYNHTVQSSICEGESYIFGTETLTTAGEYEKTFTSILGCDSTVTLTLTVNPVYNHTEQASICEGESYAFGTETLTTAGEYEHTFTSVNGCDSTVTLTLTVNPVYNHTVQAGICEGESYPFGTETLTTSGEYEKTFTSINGCDSTVTLILTVYPTYNNPVSDCDVLTTTVNDYSETSNLLTNVHTEYGEEFSLADWNDLLAIDDIDAWIACKGLQDQDYFWILNNGQHFYDGIRHYFVQYYPGGAPGFFDVHAEIGNKLFLGSWYGLQMPILAKNNNPSVELQICSNELPYHFGTQWLTDPGQYTEVFQTIHGCDSTVTITLTVNPVYNHTDVASICQGESFRFGTQTLTTAGEYEETFTSVNGCDSTVTLTLTVNPVYNTTESLTVYEDDLPLQFGSQSLTAAGTFTETFSTAAVCDSTVTLTLTVKPADITPPVVVCNPISVSLNSSGLYALTDDDILDITEGTTDNDSEYEDLIFAVVPAEFSCSQAGTAVQVMVVVTDLRANSDTCYTTVQVSDAIQPEITCRNTSLTLDDYGLATLNTSDVYSSATDGCGIQSVTASKTSFNCQDLGSQIIQVTATDNNNNSQTCIATVYVNDYLSPVFESVGNPVVTAADGACTASIIYPRIYASDNCGNVDIQHFEGLGENGIFPAGITVERWVAIDGSGNSDTLRFEIQVLTNPAKPGFDTLAVVEILEDSDWISVHLTHVYDGLDCEDSSLEFSLQLENELLFDRHQFNYITGKDSALLELLPAPDAFGETKAVITVRNAETNLEHSDTLTLRITPVNDPPFVVRPLEDLQTRAGDTLKMFLVPEQGYYFDDVDDETLQLSLKMSNGKNIPGWLQFRNDSILAFPAIADTGCINLILVAADLAGEEVHSPFVFCVGFPVGNQLFDSQKLKVYPNPTTGKVYVDFLKYTGEKINISVINYLGQEVLQKIYQGEERFEIDLTGKSSGMYIIRAKGKDLDANYRIILKPLK